MNRTPHPIKLLIGAIGGEGGGVLMNWLVDAANAQGLPVQSTSVPGVAQRTGATTYYIEIFPEAPNGPDDHEPVLSLYPCVGDVDLVVASELVEAGRMIERGFVHPDRTLLIASTHRVYSIAEKMAGDDARFDPGRVLHAAGKMARKAILFDAENTARTCAGTVNAVLLGAIAGSGLLPLPQSCFTAAIRAEGKAVEANLAGFANGLACSANEKPPLHGNRDSHDTTCPEPRPGKGAVQALRDRVLNDFPQPAHATLQQAVLRLVDYHNGAYARRYLERMDTVASAVGSHADGTELTLLCARKLALWMCYEDVIRVAQLKTRRQRMQRIRMDLGVHAGQIVRIADFLKPGIDELCTLLPPVMARPLLRWAARGGPKRRLQIGMQVHTSSFSGFLMLWILAKLKPLRTLGYRYQQEQIMIANWLDLLRRAAAVNQKLALEVARCATLIRGYGETRARGLQHFRRIVKDHIEPVLTGAIPPDSAVAAIAQARQAAMHRGQSRCTPPASKPPVPTKVPETT